LYRSIKSLKIENDGPKLQNETFNIGIRLFPNIEMPTNTCYYLDFVNRDLRSSQCHLWGISLEECNYLFKDVFKSCLRWAPEFSSDGNAWFMERYYWIQRIYPLFTARNRVSSFTAKTPLVIVRAPCDLPKVDIKTHQKCVKGISCDEKYVDSLTYYKSKDLLVQSKVKINCSATDVAIFDWKIRFFNETLKEWANYSDLLRIHHKENYTILFSGRDVATLSFPKRTIDYGLYEFCLNVTMEDVEGNEFYF